MEKLTIDDIIEPLKKQTPISLQTEANQAIDEIFVKEPEIEIKSNIIDAQNHEPDRYAESFKMAKENNLPVETVERNFDEIKKRTRIKTFDNEFERLFEENPETLDFLRDRDNARIARDDIGILGNIETGFKTFGSNFQKGIFQREQSELGFKLLTEKINEEQVSQRLKELNELLADDPDKEGFINDFVAPAGKILGQMFPGQIKALAGGVAGASGAIALGQLGPQAFIPEEVVTVPVAFGAGYKITSAYDAFTQEAGGAYLDLMQIEKEAGKKIDPFLKKGAATFVGLVNASLEMVSLDVVSKPYKQALRKFIGESVKDAIVDETASLALKKFFMSYAKAIGTESFTEMLQEGTNVIVEQIVQDISYEDFQNMTKSPEQRREAVNRIFQVGSETARGMVLLGVFGPGAEFEQDYFKARKAQSNKQMMLNFGEETKNAKLLQRSPEKFREFISKTKGKVEDVYFDANDFDTYFQSKNIDPLEVAKQLGVESKLKEARQIGIDFQIPLENYAQKLAGSEHHEALVEFIKLKPEDMTPKQASGIVEKNITELVREQAERVKKEEDVRNKQEAPSERVFEEVRQQLVQAGRTTDVASKEAILWKAFFNTLQEKTGKDAYSLYKGQDVSIIRETPDILRLQEFEKKGFERQKIVEEARRSNAELQEQDLLGILDQYESLQKDLNKLPKGRSLIQFIKDTGGIYDEGGELKSRDFAKQVPFALRKKRFDKKGKDLSFDAIGERAFEAGYFPTRPTVNQVINAIDNEMRGIETLVTGEDVGVREERTILEEQIQEIESQDIDLEKIKELKKLGAPKKPTKKLIERAKTFLQKITGKETEERRGAFVKADGQKIIKLFEQADLSTFLHESGHFFFEVMADTTQQKNVTQEIVNDYNAILKFLEVENREQVGMEQHEKFARAFESYLFEGKAPSVELQSVFTRFKHWLINVYRNIRNLNVKINDDLRGVFDRMLATQDEIEIAEQLNNYQPQLTEQDMTPQEFQKYIEASEKSTQLAEEQLLKKTMAEIKREKLKWYQEEKAKIRDKIRESIMQKPVNQAQYYLENGELYKGNLIKSLRNLKFDYKTLFNKYGEKIFKDLRKDYYRKKNGVNPDIIAEMFAFDSGDALIQALTKDTRTLNQKVEEITNTEIKKTVDEVVIEKEATNEIRNNARANFLEIELKILGKKTGQDFKSAKDIAKGASRRILSETQVKDIQVNKYAVAEGKASKLAQEAIARGDFVEAINQKRKQLLNHYLTVESRKVREDINRGFKYLVSFNKKSKRKKIGKARANYLEQIDALLDQYEIKKISVKKLESRQSLLSFVTEQQEKGQPINIPPQILEQASQINYKQVTSDKFLSLVDSVKNIEHIANFKGKLMIENRIREIRDIANEISIKASETLKPKELAFNPNRASEKRKAFIRGIGSAILKVQTYIEKLDGGEKAGKVYQFLKAPIDEASNARAERMEKEVDRFTEIMLKHYGKEGKTFKDKARNLIAPVQNLTSKETQVYIESLNESLTLEERLTIALNVGTADNKIKLLQGRNMSENQLDDILNTLTKNDWDFVQDVWDYLESFWPETSALERELSGISATKLEPAVVSTKFGNYKGGYFPLSYVDKRIQEADYFNQIIGGGFNSTNVTRKSQKERVKGVRKRVDVSGLNTINSHITESVNAITMGRAIHNVDQLLRNDKIKDTIERYISPEAYQEFNLWLKDIAVNGISSNDSISKIFRNLRTSTTIGAMGLKTSTSIVQFLGFAHSFVEVGAKNVLSGVKSMFVDGKPWEIAQQIRDKSRFMRDRATTFNRDINDTIKSLRGDTLQSKLVGIYFYPIAKMQLMVDYPTWLGAYKKAINEGRSEKQAIQYADITVENAQGTGLAKGLSRFERGTLDERIRMAEIVKAFNAFYSYYNTKLNIAVRETQQTNFKKPGQVLKLASNYLTLFWFEAFLSDLILGRLPDFDDDDPEEKFAAYSSKLFLSQMAMTVPFGREVSSALQGFDAMPAGLRSLADTAKGVKSLYDVSPLSDKEINGYKELDNILKAVNILSPIKIPTAQISVILKALERQEEGEDINISDFLLKKPKK